MRLARARFIRSAFVRVVVSASGGGGGGDSDYMASVISSLAVDTWSGNVALNAQTVCKERSRTDPDFGTYYAYDGVTTITTPGAEIPFSFSSGVYAPEWRCYIHTGGGHNDWCGSEVSKFDMTTGLWSRTDESAKLALSVTDPTVPFQSGDTSGQRAWRNPSGRFAPISSHMYGGMSYMSHNAQVYVHGAAPFQSGTGGVGGSTWIDVSSGHWNEAGAYPGAPGGSTDCTSHYLTSCVVMTSVNGTATGEVHPGVWRVVENRDGYLVNVCVMSHVGKVQFFSAAGARTTHGTIIPDPQNPGWKAYVAHSSVGGAIIQNMVNLSLPTSAAHHNTQNYAYAASAPASAVGHGTWIYMGDYVPGCEKIAVWNAGVGLYCLDISTSAWTWTTVTPGEPAAVSSYGQEPGNKRFFYMPDYEAFGVWNGVGSALYVLRKPAIFS
jgi:hypothetical protein